MKATPLFRFDPQHRRQIAGLVRGTGATQSISDLIRAFEALEKQFDDALTRQDRLSRAVFTDLTLRRMSEDTAETAPHAAGSGRMTGRPFGEFRGAVEIARKCIRNALPLTTRRFIENLDRPEGSEIGILEAEIARLQSEMRVLETQILQYLPQCLEDVSAKLKFVVSLMLDSQEIDTDYFAFLVEECAEVMDSSISHLRVAASITAEKQGW
jgi:hypothetical protein